jgi:hypothetical protein
MMQTKSKALFARAAQLLPGGVNSPVRAFRAVGGTPFFVQRAAGPYLYDVDGNRYIDYVCAYGPLILGHAPAVVANAVTEAVARGWSYGAPHPLEITLAELIAAALPSVEQVRFVNSGTEATMSALRAPLPAAPASSSSTAATTATPTPSWSAPAPAWRRWACRTAQACRPRQSSTPAASLTTTSLPWRPPSPKRRALSPR